MGIQGLLPQLKSVMAPVHIKDLEGCSVAVDTYSWLHKGALSCGRDLCKGIPTTRHIDYCMNRVNLLRHYGVKPVLVFDGGLLPMKIEQENKRARSRKENLTRASEHEANGNGRAAFECYQKAVDISPLIAHDLIRVLRRENISYVVAPYEADAQMAFLAISKQVDAVVTEDSDLIPYGCPRIIYKMDKFGQGLEFRHSKLQQNKELNFAGFTNQMLLEMCIFSGCDYLQSLPGMGVKTAHALIKKFRSYDRVIKHLKYTSVLVPSEYEESFGKAIMTFQHQRVYDPLSESIVNLTEIQGNDGGDLEYLGPLLPQDIAKGIAEGELDPFTKMPFQNGNEIPLVLTKRQNVDNIRPKSDKKKPDSPAQKNVLSKYFRLASPEAKMPFKTHGSTPPHSSPDDSINPTPPSSFSAESSDLMKFQSQESLSKDVEDHLARENPDIVDPLFYETIPVAGTGRAGSSLQQMTIPIHKSCGSSVSNNGTQNLSGVLNVKTRSETRKVIVRSPYFKQKPFIETMEDEEKENCQPDDDVPVSLPVKINGPLRAASKRKTFSEIDAPEIRKKQSVHADDLLENNGSGDHSLEPGEKPEKKFGANISHLDRYSSIAEKSLQRFVKVMDSFRFTGSGSRASGLRAPLKSAPNLLAPDRSTTSTPIEEFVYKPKSRKVALPSHRA